MQRTPDGQRYSNALFGLAALHTQTLVSLLGEFVFFFLSLSLSTSSSVQSAAVRGGLLPVRFVRALSSLFFSSKFIFVLEMPTRRARDFDASAGV